MTIRDMTEGEKQAIFDKAVCPSCGTNTWYAGPRGGFCQNHTCKKCGLGINVLEDFSIRWGQIIAEPSGYVPPVEAPPPSYWQSFLSYMKGLV